MLLLTVLIFLPCVISTLPHYYWIPKQGKILAPASPFQYMPHFEPRPLLLLRRKQVVLPFDNFANHQTLPYSEFSPPDKLEDYDDFTPRFSKLFLNPFTITKTTVVTENEHKRDKKEVCAAFGGVLVGYECLQYIANPLDYESASRYCQQRGGDLYVPEEREGFLFAKYFLYFPNAFTVGAENGTLGWIGARREGPAFPILTRDGIDVTWDPIYNIGNIVSDVCVHISTTDTVLDGDDCNSFKPFTCEYHPKLHSTKSVYPKKGYSFFNKFSSYHH